MTLKPAASVHVLAIEHKDVKDMSDDGTVSSAPSAGSTQKSGPKLYGASGEPISVGSRQMQSQSDQLAEFVEKQPFTAAMVALIVGYFIGKIT